MTTERSDFFSQYSKVYTLNQDNDEGEKAFTEHNQFPQIVDSLSRKYTHHIVLNNHYSLRMYDAFFNALLSYLAKTQIATFQKCELRHLDIPFLNLSITQQLKVENNIKKLIAELESKCILFALTGPSFLTDATLLGETLNQQIEILLLHPHCRFIFMRQQPQEEQKEQLNSSYADQFAEMHLLPPSYKDQITCLKQEAKQLEDYHQIIIQEEMVPFAYHLAGKYLSTQHTFDHALLLLDSASARVNMQDKQTMAGSNGNKPELNLAQMLQVIANITQIPVTKLQNQVCPKNEFIHAFQGYLFGQDHAAPLLYDALRTSQVTLGKKQKQLSAVLFIGPNHTGKKTAVKVLGQLYYQATNMIYCAKIAFTQQGLLDIRLQAFDQQQRGETMSLREIAQKQPYAIILFDQIDKYPTKIQLELSELLQNGLLQDSTGTQYCFNNMMFIMTTTLAAHHIYEASASLAAEPAEHFNLMQLMLDAPNFLEEQPGTSLDELIVVIRAELEKYLPFELCQCVDVIPFFPLRKNAVEKIVYNHLDDLTKLLNKQYHFELSYAPELVKFLTNHTLSRSDESKNRMNIHDGLKYLYEAVEQALNQGDKLKGTQLFLHLNETGEMLKCDWLSLNSVRHM